ncbi:SLC13 family permease [Microbacterium fluvii]|uniref:SLC13 family permease n=1 Tax=Microbacterium fluvii TaxID=415215 RepID=A0ABW2HBA3_9MICO|nr:SLC13 family permease [Microbacterium fluvii]MCU4671991.1 SLC13 family permease [Microbacterium fluvii]
MRTAISGAVLLALGAIAVAFGVLSLDEVGAIAERVWPVLLFVVAITVVAELAATAGVFDVAAAWLARVARGRTWMLWALVVLLAILATAFLSLDTTAVLLTPVVVAVARANGLPPLPFAFATVWLANTGSLFLPVSNLTNLLAEHRLDLGHPLGFLVLLGPSALVAVLVTVAVLVVVFWRRLRGRYTPGPAPGVADRGQLVAASVVVIALMPLLVSGLPPWLPSVVAALVLVGVFASRSPQALHISLVPWQLVVFASGLFLAVGVLEAWGSGALTAAAAGGGDDLIALWRLSGLGMLSANAANNLPAYLALESAAGDSPARLAALLIGVNAGPLITPWASLATLLWHERLRAVGVEVPWRRYVVLGLVTAPIVVALAVLPLAA